MFVFEFVGFFVFQSSAVFQDAVVNRVKAR